MSLPTLVLIDLQKDFYHPRGAYGRANRPLEPIHSMLKKLPDVVSGYPEVIRIKSTYRKNQFPDMPRLCLPGSFGEQWHPDFKYGPLLTKNTHSGFSALKTYFKKPRPLILAGLCTHRCVKSTLNELLSNNWPAKIFAPGVASCGKRNPLHQKCIRNWKKNNLIVNEIKTGQHVLLGAD